ncbi:MAG: DUF1080 domain-containing protein [Rhodothermales bacterium]
MLRVRSLLVLATFASVAVSAVAQPATKPDPNWEIHDMNRPQPTIVDTGWGPMSPTPPPADAIVLFGEGVDGLSAWEANPEDMDEHRPAEWTVGDGFFSVKPGTGGIRTKAGFGDVQLHVEWATPNPPRGEGQDNGNSGVFLMGQYEVQVLNSYGNKTYPDGQASALYGQYPPLVNASRAPGQWQTYDIIFHRPRFAADGSLQSPARFTVIHNGVLTQDNVSLTGATAHHARPPYEAHADALPIALQDHGHPVRFRNIWLREL